MAHSFNFVTIVLLLGASQGVFLAFLLFNKPGNKTANRFLALLMISYSAFIAESSISGTPLAMKFPHLLGLAAGVIFLVPPLHYLYARSLISSDFTFSKKQLLHFIPFISFYLYYLFPYYLKSGAYKITHIETIALEGSPPDLVFFNWVVIFQGIIYMGMTLRLLKKHSLNIKDNFSSIEKINLNWLRNITVMTIILWSLGLVIEFLQLFDLALSVDVLVALATAILIYAMGYLGLRQPEIFSGNTEIKDLKKYERSGLTKTKAQELHEKLVHLMETKKPFTDSNLKLNQLAKMISTTPNYLSQVINEERQQNFFDFVNWYRIEEAKKLIKDASDQQSTLLSIAYEVGFNSKSAFNTSFKKHTQRTPSQYRKDIFS
ncbi:helix-turn-helix domain-containing protein [candidate division KSB1 bacterium]|nr:helix-turn-helix domain-containing protein [candidate division KSB1 bacterium]